MDRNKINEIFKEMLEDVKYLKIKTVVNSSKSVAHSKEKV